MAGWTWVFGFIFVWTEMQIVAYASPSSSQAGHVILYPTSPASQGSSLKFLDEKAQITLIDQANQGQQQTQEDLFTLHFQGMLSRDLRSLITLKTWGKTAKQWIKRDLKKADLIMLLRPSFFQNKPRLIASIKEKASKGEGMAQYILARLYEKGYFGDKKLMATQTAALHWHCAAAQQDVVGSHYRLARALQRGYGHAVDIPKALLLYRVLSDKGHIKAQFYAGFLLQEAQQATPQARRNYEKCLVHYEKAARAGLLAGKYNEALCYMQWQAVSPQVKKQNERKARELLEDAANKGYAQACEVLARAYQFGELGVRRSNDKVLYYVDKGKDMTLLRLLIGKTALPSIAEHDQGLDQLVDRLGVTLAGISLEVLKNEPEMPLRDRLWANRHPIHAVHNLFLPVQALAQKAMDYLAFLAQSEVMVSLFYELPRFSLPRTGKKPIPPLMMHYIEAGSRKQRFLTFGESSVQKAEEIHQFILEKAPEWESAQKSLQLLHKLVSQHYEAALSDYLTVRMCSALECAEYDAEQMNQIAQRMQYWQIMAEDFEVLEKLPRLMKEVIISHAPVRNKRFRDNNPWVDSF